MNCKVCEELRCQKSEPVTITSCIMPRHIALLLAYTYCSADCRTAHQLRTVLFIQTRVHGRQQDFSGGWRVNWQNICKIVGSPKALPKTLVIFVNVYEIRFKGICCELRSREQKIWDNLRENSIWRHHFQLPSRSSCRMIPLTPTGTYLRAANDLLKRNLRRPSLGQVTQVLIHVNITDWV